MQGVGWPGGSTPDFELRGPGFDPHLEQCPCCVLEQDTLTPHSNTQEVVALSQLDLGVK